MENKDQLTDQLLQGVYRLCVNMDDCFGCPFHKTKCVFGEPMPRTWFDEDTINNTAAAHASVNNTAGPKTEPAAPENRYIDDDTEGTWLLSTSMGGVFSKYVFICSKCGYRKDSVLSLTPMASCPECEKRKAIKKLRGE